MESLPPATLMCWRYLLSGGAMLLAGRLAGARLPRGRELWIAAACGLMVIGAGTGMLAFVEQWAPSGLSALWAATSPFWLVAAEAALPGGAPLHAPTLAALLAGVAGVAVLVSGENVSPNKPGGPGLLVLFLLLQIGALFWALGSILQRRRTAPIHPFVTAAVQQLAVGVAYAAPAALQIRQAHWSPRAIAATLYLAVFGGIIGYSSYVFAMNRLPVAVASLYTYINPLVAVLLGRLIYREAFSAREALGMAVIFAGAWLVKRAQGKISERASAQALK